MVADFNKKANRESSNQKLFLRGAGIFLIVLACFLIVSDIKIYQKKKELVSEIGNYQKQVADIKKSSQTLQTEIDNADNTDYLEKLGYEQLGQTRPGETEYMFIKSQNTAPAGPSAQPEAGFWNIGSWTGWLSGTWQWIKNQF